MAADLTVERASGTQPTQRSFNPWTSDRAIRIGLSVALAAVLGQIVTQLIDFQVYGLRIAVLDSDTHASIFGVASLVAQAAAAAAAAVRGVHAVRRAGWFLLAAILALLLVVRAVLPDDPPLLVVPLAFVCAMVWSLTTTDPARTRRIVRAALALLAFSFVVHIVGLKIVEALGYGYRSWAYELKGLLKHTTELAGWILVATGLLAGERDTASLRARRRWLR